MKQFVTLNDNSPAIIHLRRADARVARVIEAVGAFTYEIYDDEYEFLIGSIVGQMISGRAAERIFARLQTACEGRVSLAATRELTDRDLQLVGFSRPKISYVRALNEALETRALDFDELRGMPDDAVFKALTSIRGIGSWTATMYLIFVLDRQDVVSAYDRCFLEVYRWLYNTTDVSVASIKKRAKKWSPYSSVVARYFYKVLDLGLTHTKFKLR